MAKQLWLTLTVLQVSFQAMGQHAGAIREISLTHLDGTIARPDIPDGKPFVVIVLGSDCPISQKYIPAIKTLRASFEKQVDFLAVFPAYFSPREVATFKKDYALSFPCYIDQNMRAIGLLRATVTPEVFLFGPDLGLEYSGAIDNWFYDLGRYRLEATHHYLKDAIGALLNGATIDVQKTEAIGCLIQRNSRPSEKEHIHH